MLNEQTWVIDLSTEAGQPVGRATVRPDWQPALAWVRFEAIRDGRLPADAAGDGGTVEPIWDASAGAPVVGGLRGRVVDGGVEVTREIPKRYLRGAAERAAAALVEAGALEEGDPFRWVVRAFTGDHAPGEDALADGLEVESPARCLPLSAASLATFTASASPIDAPDPADLLPVFLPRSVLDETLALAAEAGDLETGGVLVGRLHRDVDAAPGELFVEITAQLPAEHTRRAATKLTFTAATWAAAHAAVEQRRRGEMLIGWWHLHPRWCRLRGCPPERWPSCTASVPFFSAEDVLLHATCFPAPYHTALLLTDSPAAGGLVPALYGWWEGLVVRRGLHLLEPRKEQ